MNEGELLVIGLTENVLAEYSYGARDGSPFTCLELWDGEVMVVKGYDSKADLLAVADDAVAHGCKVYRFFGGIGEN